MVTGLYDFSGLLLPFFKCFWKYFSEMLLKTSVLIPTFVYSGICGAKSIFPQELNINVMKNRKQNKAGEYKIANEIFLERKSLEEGMAVLESGIIMHQLVKGSGTKCPQLNSIVFVRYTGKLIDGTVFDTTDSEALPACFRVRELIVGWQAALLRMHEGDTYEIFIPAKYGYGSMRLDDIPAWSTLCFTLTLEKIQQ